MVSQEAPSGPPAEEDEGPKILNFPSSSEGAPFSAEEDEGPKIEEVYIYRLNLPIVQKTHFSLLNHLQSTLPRTLSEGRMRRPFTLPPAEEDEGLCARFA